MANNNIRPGYTHVLYHCRIILLSLDVLLRKFPSIRRRSARGAAQSHRFFLTADRSLARPPRATTRLPPDRRRQIIGRLLVERADECGLTAPGRSSTPRVLNVNAHVSVSSSS